MRNQEMGAVYSLFKSNKNGDDQQTTNTTTNTTQNTNTTAAGGGGGTSSSRNRTSNSSASGSTRTRNADEPHIGKYRLIKTIGKGNFAKVKLAKHELIGKEVIIEQLSNDFFKKKSKKFKLFYLGCN